MSWTAIPLGNMPITTSENTAVTPSILGNYIVEFTSFPEAFSGNNRSLLKNAFSVKFGR